MSPMLAPEPRSDGPVTVISSLAVNLACTFCSSAQTNTATQLVEDFWDDGKNCADELILLAHRAGALGASTFEDLAAAVAVRPVLTPKPRLASEDTSTRDLLLHRLELLGRSARRRAAYVAMLGRAWEDFRPTWEAGSRTAELTVSRYRARLENGLPWQELPSTPRTAEFLPPLLARVGYDVPIILVPALSFGQMFVLDVDDGMMVAAPVPHGSAELGTEQLTRQLKALAHPTRLAVIRDLTSEARSVGELARSFDVAQPTMTSHVKILRDAGLLRAADAGGRRDLQVDTDAVRHVLAELSTLAELETAVGSPTSGG